MSGLKKAQQDFLKKGATAADSPREMTGATNTMAQTAVFVGRVSEPPAAASGYHHNCSSSGAQGSRKQTLGGGAFGRESDLEATVKQNLHSMK
eukprot:CAMPEP_0170466266 /NCGR_PEP_ID=MMETSP0123-20130129/10292_1 /TAXON_ID=182087 /ORGANISM="Favella ehrenbergii, Strain Fehren 1" /LENGTH=92 /DNA_ID=CAMNT_0010732355 /DNA_START=2356 /DNA_END=2631 /DNA_ORIENTATION=+